MGLTEATETCPYCESENTYPGWDVKKQGYVAVCKTCGKPIFLCDECLHEPGGKNVCDWYEKKYGKIVVGFCRRGKTVN